MTKLEKQQAIHSLFAEGVSKKKIARLLTISVKTVRKVLATETIKRKERNDKIVLDDTMLRTLYQRCDGYVQRVYEILTEEYGISIGYSTVTQRIRELHLSIKPSKRSEHYPDIPGEEMQHDTTVYTILLNGKKTRLVCSGIYLRYSKMRYVKFYRRFNRFTMKCFFDEALRFWGYSASTCIIDNTSLAIDYGSGSNAHFSKEMVAFAQHYNFQWFAHAINHPNRKAGKERNFHTMETNFLPGRTFTSLENINEQALKWATERYARRPQAKTKLIPIELFEIEKTYLQKLPQWICTPYREHQRILDAYGYIAFAGNYYMLPQTQGKKITVLEYAQHIDLYEKNSLLLRYPLPPDKTHNEIFIDKSIKKKKIPRPHDYKNKCHREEKILRQSDKIVDRYIDFVQSKKSLIPYKKTYIRKLYTLYKRTALSLFADIIKKALHYQINTIGAIQELAAIEIEQAANPSLTVETPLYNEYENRESYINGKIVEENEGANG